MSVIPRHWASVPFRRDVATKASIIHIISPDIQDVTEHISKQTAMMRLQQTYQKIFGIVCAYNINEHNSMPIKTLRMPPIAGGQTVGQFKDMHPEMTITAIGWAFKALTPTQQAHMTSDNLSIQLCVYDQSEFQDYRAALEQNVQFESDRLSKAMRTSTGSGPSASTKPSQK